MERNALRKMMLERRDASPAGYREASDEAICETLLGLPEYDKARVIFCYIGVRSEVGTLSFIKKALADGKRVCAPVLEGGGVMKAKEISGPDDVAPSVLGLLEPKDGRPETPADEISLVVTPCVCCDRDGNRLGYGRGYYDRYLALSKADVVVLCRERNICEGGIAPLPHDARADVVVTERGAFRRSGERRAAAHL
jgi:5-formyltetrahydrofolate cyclo-ligase